MDSVRNKNYKFAEFDTEDLAQESYLIGLKVMEKYKPEHGCILHFLYVAVHNRIKNLMRDKLKREVPVCSNENTPEYLETIGNSKTPANEFWEMIDEHLPFSFRRDYLKMKQGLYVPKFRKQKIINEIRKIINEEL